MAGRPWRPRRLFPACARRNSVHFGAPAVFLILFVLEYVFLVGAEGVFWGEGGSKHFVGIESVIGSLCGAPRVCVTLFRARTDSSKAPEFIG